MIKKIRHISSYLLPVVIRRRKGEITLYLEVLLVNGKYVLDTSSVNYSYGGLHKVFQKTFIYFNLKKLEFENVLILGFGAGSVASILTEEYGMKCKIIGIEKDSVVIDLAKKYFNIDRFKNLELVHESAYTYVQHIDRKFDLIIMDVFVDETVPKMFHEENFLQHLNRILSNNGVLFYNFMNLIHKIIWRPRTAWFKSKTYFFIFNPQLLNPPLKLINLFFFYKKCSVKNHRILFLG